MCRRLRPGRGSWSSTRPDCGRGPDHRPLFCPCRLGMGANHGAIPVLPRPIAVARGIPGGEQRRAHPLPDPRVLPAPDAAVNRSPLALALRHIAPGRADPQSPADAVAHRAMVAVRCAAARGLRRREQGRPSSPLVISHIRSVVHPQVYSSMQTDPSSLSRVFRWGTRGYGPPGHRNGPFGGVYPERSRRTQSKLRRMGSTALRG